MVYICFWYLIILNTYLYSGGYSAFNRAGISSFHFSVTAITGDVSS